VACRLRARAVNVEQSHAACVPGLCAPTQALLVEEGAAVASRLDSGQQVAGPGGIRIVPHLQAERQAVQCKVQPEHQEQMFLITCHRRLWVQERTPTAFEAPAAVGTHPAQLGHPCPAPAPASLALATPIQTPLPTSARPVSRLTEASSTPGNLSCARSTAAATAQ
jgi:hypothetical protein